MAEHGARWAVGLAACLGAAALTGGLGVMRAADRQQAIAGNASQSASIRARLWTSGDLSDRNLTSSAALYRYGVASTVAGAALLALAVSGHLWELADARDRLSRASDEPPAPPERR